jgi:hypothetical protein
VRIHTDLVLPSDRILSANAPSAGAPLLSTVVESDVKSTAKRKSFADIIEE